MTIFPVVEATDGKSLTSTVAGVREKTTVLQMFRRWIQKGEILGTF